MRVIASSGETPGKPKPVVVDRTIGGSTSDRGLPSYSAAAAEVASDSAGLRGLADDAA